MLKKRLIFTLLYNQGQFMLSRNFRLQKVGDLKWLKTNYDFSQVSYSIDELIVLDVTRGARHAESFYTALKALAEGCFIPISAGGGIRSIEHARGLLRSGADKVVVNSLLYESAELVRELAAEFGQQCVVASMDIKSSSDGSFRVWTESGARCVDGEASDWINKVAQNSVGEIYLNSVDRDGTGHGYEMKLLDLLPAEMTKPVILAGGAGNAAHLAQGLADSRVDAVATAHLFNFVGDGLKKARMSLIAGGVDLPVWDTQLLERYATPEGTV